MTSAFRDPEVLVALTDACCRGAELGNGLAALGFARAEGLAALADLAARAPEAAVLVPVSDPVLWLADRLDDLDPDAALAEWARAQAAAMELRTRHAGLRVALVDDRALAGGAAELVAALQQALQRPLRLKQLPPLSEPSADRRALAELILGQDADLAEMVQDWRAVVTGASAPARADLMAAADLWRQAGTGLAAPIWDDGELRVLRRLVATQAEQLAALTRHASALEAGQPVQPVPDADPEELVLARASLTALDNQRLAEAEAARRREAVLVAQILADGARLRAAADPEALAEALAEVRSLREALVTANDALMAAHSRIQALESEISALRAPPADKPPARLRAARRLLGKTADAD